jgi:GNAT superfamily N-acetyltransferase
MPIAVRSVQNSDIPAMAAIRAKEWESDSFWVTRIDGYLSGELSPQQALLARAALVAVDGNAVVGFVAGHKTRRHSCDGELQWMNVAVEQRRQGIATLMLAAIAAWFIQQQALRIYVDVSPVKLAARTLCANMARSRSTTTGWFGKIFA